MTAVCLVVVRRYPPQFLYLRKLVLDLVPPLVGVAIVVTILLAVRFWWDERSCATRINFFKQPIRIERDLPLGSSLAVM